MGQSLEVNGAVEEITLKYLLIILLLLGTLFFTQSLRKLLRNYRHAKLHLKSTEPHSGHIIIII